MTRRPKMLRARWLQQLSNALWELTESFVCAECKSERRMFGSTCEECGSHEACGSCGACDHEYGAEWVPPRRQEQQDEQPELVERRRGYTDALAGHGPALFDGPYMIGYRRGRAEIGQPMSYMPPKQV